MDSYTQVIQALHRACGGVEIARDLVGRSGALYLRTELRPDRELAESFAHASVALTRVLDALQLKSTQASPQP